MKNIKIILPNIIICIVISLVAIILPVEIKNTTSFIYNLICFIVFNIIGCFVNNSLIENNLKKDLNNTPVFYLYIIFNILLVILLFISKVVNITINISIILTLILFTIYFLMVYSLIHAKKYINNHNDKIDKNTYNVRNWISTIEILLTKEGKNNKDLNKLYETLKYMDVTSNDSTYEIDSEINELIKKVKKNIEKETILSIEKLVNERKIILKNGKR